MRGEMMDNWEEEIIIIHKNLEVFDHMIAVLREQNRLLNERLNIIEKRRPQVREYLQN